LGSEVTRRRIGTKKPHQK